MATLIDTNVLVYRYDPRFPAKQSIAQAVVEAGVRSGELFVPHQAVIELVAATTRLHDFPDGRRPLLTRAEACREAEELLGLLPILYPTEGVLAMALRGFASYGLSWFDAHLWAYAELYGLHELLSEDFEHERLYGTVRVIDPFAQPGEVHEPSPPPYG